MPKGLQGFQKGNAPLNTGRTRFKKGQSSWNKGRHYKIADTSKMSLAKIGKKRPDTTKRMMGNTYAKGLVPWNKNKIGTLIHTKKWKTMMSERMKGNQHPLGNKLSETSKEKIRQFQINNPNRIFKDTSIELKVEVELKRRNINYQKQVPLYNIAIVDFYLPEYSIVIQCDGDYWHNKLKQKFIDERQNRLLTFHGFNIYRFWQHEINESVENCINRVLLI